MFCCPRFNQILFYTFVIIQIVFILIRAEEENFNGQGKVVGGEKSPKYYPYQLSLQVQSDSTKPWQHNCGGSIVSLKCGVTAAHCISGWNVNYLSVVAGIKKLNDQTGPRYLLTHALLHPDYVALNSSDISMFTVDRNFEFSNIIQPIPYSKEYVKGDVECILTGWGYSNIIKFGNIPNDLQRVKVRTITNDNCNKRSMTVGKSEICSSPRFLRGACAGDSGGPLAVNDGEFLAGIVSYGTAICTIGLPDVYTRVSTFVTWMDQYIQNAENA